MKAYLRAGDAEHALHEPLSRCLLAVADHLGSSVRVTFDRIAKLDRERTPGEHVFDRHEMLQLVAVAHALLAQPPDKVRRLRRVAEGPLPTAERIGLLRDWLQQCSQELVVYDLWRSLATPADS
jgi:hypothetical protein